MNLNGFIQATWAARSMQTTTIVNDIQEAMKQAGFFYFKTICKAAFFANMIFESPSCEEQGGFK